MRSLKIGIDELEDLLRAKTDLGVEYEYVGCPMGFKMVQEDFDIDGSTFKSTYYNEYHSAYGFIPGYDLLLI
jgi:hypothetical protein